MYNYFLPNCVYFDEDFQRQFCMPRHLVKKIIEDLCLVEPQFDYQFDAQNIRGHSPEQDFTLALRILGYGRPADGNDEYLRMGKITLFTYLSLFYEETRRDKEWTNYADGDLRTEIQPQRGLPARNYGQKTNYIQNQNLYD
ncbi:uncharacterized protein LOC113361021 [Papaver somniferum]|uniref:uncharacterized protein LOC113361021 n=1 Tax=Papaver somniferum TaxID=3469 RepID=UPI000E6F8BC8|nr:uncharacterized protein LOC113361021 [Papaver somniferum]